MMIAAKAIDTPLSLRIGKIRGIIHFTFSAHPVIHSLFIVIPRATTAYGQQVNMYVNSRQDF